MLGSRTGIKTLLLLGIPVLVICAFFSLTRCAVVWDGEVVVVARDREIAEAAVNDYLEQLESSAGMPVKINADTVKYRPTWRFGAVEDKKEIQLCLAQKLDHQYEASGIFVDGKQIVAVKDKAVAQQVLDKLLNTYSVDEDEKGKLSFKQQVEIKPVTVDRYDLMDADRAVEYIRFGGVEVREYKVKEGDTLWDVAIAAKLPVEELMEANPDLTPETMQIGQQIKISRPAPLVDVLTTYQDVRREEMSFRVQEKVDQNLYWGEQKLVQKGSPGQREVVYEVTLENGLETKRRVLEQKVIKEPVPQVIAKGNKKLLAFRGGNGRLAYPTVGSIVSPFGQRWGRVHEGVDIAANYGSPVVAAEAGTVQRAGYRGGYGLCIDISHGSGVVTRYAHLSSAAVKPGQRVERGQFIGRAGSSGNSTGPHLHFEVIVNGVPKNPALFI
ncbi:peptidoglycan DD-metalloendopeptidase family protein [Desulfallas thermosapovorans]|uniref:Murein DD-endopeptidase MepM/ murein hydrolase activator NlpD n=1 Tax=Desulfallas thermosapovorans DSM 6562 TaxID=1121431 RepID=A0A5S4ZUK6_9FIRM|nr:M23 family metallopeptidase [Desulfallas thermosapovorans]TYO96482.1 murein DD-endopeptidase MepM/ murein hydrolase activator NlpD [Desulfallas thermosapovorans DSM 6562]